MKQLFSEMLRGRENAAFTLLPLGIRETLGTVLLLLANIDLPIITLKEVE